VTFEKMLLLFTVLGSSLLVSYRGTVMKQIFFELIWNTC